MTNKINKVPQHKTIPATPATPDTGFGKIYIKSDGNWYGLDDQGVETLLSGGGGGGTPVISITYNDLSTAITNSTLVPGKWYNLSYTISGDPGDPNPIDVDYDIYLLAIDEKSLDLINGKRIMNTPIYVPGTVEPWYSSETYALNDRVIYCNRVWRNILAGTGSIQGTYNLNSANWVIESGSQYYKPKVYDITYSFIDQEIIVQRDSYNNVIRGYQVGIGNLMSPQNPIDISDWCYSGWDNQVVSMHDNDCYGMWNNIFRFSSLPLGPGQIVWNKVNGLIYNNLCSRVSRNHMTYGPIRNNNIGGGVDNNTATGIYDNTGAISIGENSIIGAIHHNTFGNGIYSNTNAGNITHNNIGNSIHSNSNNGDITANDVAGISHNNNDGNIRGNSGGTISFNSNSGVIESNEVQGTLSNNSNGDDIDSNITPGSICNNSGNGLISSNTVTGNIEYNMCGDINLNTNVNISHNMGGNILYNHNTGDIKYNNVSGMIQDNTNDGDINLNVCESVINNASSAGDIINNVCKSIAGNGQ